MSTVVDTEANVNYEPSEGEIIEYGKWLGMKLPEDNPFLWIAREGLKAPLPENWRACQSDKGELYYFNFKTGQSIWDHPMDEHFKELFKSEKLNPTPRSIASGAKRKDETTAGKKEGKNKKKLSVDRSGKAPPSPAADHTTPAPTTTPPAPSTATPQAQSNANETKEPAPTVQSLNSLKVKKELPKEMRIEFDANAVERRSPKHTASAQQQPTLLGTAELCTVATHDEDSSEEPSPKKKPKKKPKSDAGTAKLDSPAAAGGGSGLKSLRMLSENNNNNNRTSSAGDEGSLSTAAAEAAAAAAAVAAEKERIVAEGKAELEKLRSQMARERKEEEQALLSENAKVIKEARDKYEAEKQTKIKEARRMAEEAVREEHRNIESEMKSALEQARKDFSSQKSAEIRRLKENYKEQLEQEKKKLADEHSENLEAFAREQRKEYDARREALSQSARESEKTLENELNHFTSSIVRGYEESYAAFAKSISGSQNDFALRSFQQKEEVQRELDAQIAEIRNGHEAAIAAEKRRFQQELDDLQTKLAADKTRAAEAGERELEEIRSQAASKASQLRSSEEKGLLAEALADLRASQAKELEALKAELRQKAEEELKAAVAEVTQEQKLRMSTLPSPREAPQKSDQERSPSLQVDSDLSGGTKPPLLDGNLLRSREGSIPDTYATLRDTQAKDIKSAVTEALREMFAESPFTLPSPARGSMSTSPSRQDATTGAAAGRRPSLSGSTAVVMDPVSTGGPLSRSQKNAGFSFPVSFQEQRDLVEGERLRVREGRRFVEAQRRNLEDRRQQLRRTRHQWKQDVMAAKEEGVRSSSKRGQLLNKVRLALEEQAQELERDEAVLHESMGWLQSKEQRVMQLEQQIEEQERLRALGDNSTVNCSVDTAALVTGYFKSQRGGGPFSLDAPPGGLSGRRLSQSVGAANFTPFESPATTPVLSTALSRIERRLDEVTSLINLQKAQTRLTPSRASPRFQQQSGSRKTSQATPLTPQSQSRHRSSRSHSKAVSGAADAGGENHVDPW